MLQTALCCCKSSLNGKTRRRVRRTWGDLVEFCMVQDTRYGRVRAQIKYFRDGRWRGRGTTASLAAEGTSLCIVYRPREGEEGLEHQVNLVLEDDAKALIRY
jgi:hypothetical protein